MNADHAAKVREIEEVMTWVYEYDHPPGSANGVPLDVIRKAAWTCNVNAALKMIRDFLPEGDRAFCSLNWRDMKIWPDLDEQEKFKLLLEAATELSIPF